MKTTFNLLIPQIPTYCGQEIVLPLNCKIPFQIFLFLTFLFVLSWEKNWWSVVVLMSLLKMHLPQFRHWHGNVLFFILEHPPLHLTSLHLDAVWCIGHTMGSILWIKTFSIYMFVFFLACEKNTLWLLVKMSFTHYIEWQPLSEMPTQQCQLGFCSRCDHLEKGRMSDRP